MIEVLKPKDQQQSLCYMWEAHNEKVRAGSHAEISMLMQLLLGLGARPGDGCPGLEAAYLDL